MHEMPKDLDLIIENVPRLPYVKCQEFVCIGHFIAKSPQINEMSNKVFQAVKNLLKKAKCDNKESVGF